MPLPFGSSILSYSLSAKLKHTCIKLIIFSMVCNKCVVVTTLYDVSMFKHHYRIGVSYGGKSVSDYEYRSALHQTVHALFDEGFRSCINGRCCFIKDKNGRIRNGRSCNGKKLSLTL